MFRVLIADDEPSLIQSLAESIEWSELGLELIATAGNGRQALEIIREQRIDIAIIDIRMPGLSGLELCEIVAKEEMKIQIIIISGYAEFSYAERAIGYGVLGYCLKPLEYEKVTRLLLKAVKNLEKDIPAISGVDLLDALERGDNAKVQNILEHMGFGENSFYVTVTIGEGCLNLSANESIVMELGRGQFGYISKLPVPKNVLLEWTKDEESRGAGQLHELTLRTELLSDLQKCSIQAHQFFIDSMYKIGERRSETRANEILSSISKCIEKNQWEIVCNHLAIIDKKYKKYFSIHTAMKLCNMIYTSGLFQGEEKDYYVYSLKQLVADYTCFSKMLKKLQQEICQAKAVMEPDERFTNTAFLKLMSFIEENYRKDISLTSAGEALHMNPNYVSQLFKKEAGITFVQYITQLRMDEAIRLLLTTKQSVVNISIEVGVNDYFYFLKLFKKYTGKTPSQFRDEN